MKPKIVFKALICLLFFTALTAGGKNSAARETAAPHWAEILITGESKYQSVRLTPGIYNASSADLSDLRIYNSADEDVPYFLHSKTTETNTTRTAYPLELTGSYLKFDAFYFDYKLASENDNTDTMATSLEFSTGSTDFAKTAELSGSHDGINWEFVQQDRLYSVDGSSKLYINFSEPQKFTHYRLKLANNLEAIRFDEANLIYNLKTVNDSYFIVEFSPSFISLAEGERETSITIHGLKNLKLPELRISSADMFKRPFRAENGTVKELYNLSFSDMSVSDMVFPLNDYVPGGETFELTVENGDDKSIAIDSVTARYYADELVFENTPGEAYRLKFGIPEEAPVYDIVRYKDRILNEEIDKARLGEIRYADPAALDKSDYSVIFNVVVLCVGLLLGAVIIKGVLKGVSK